MRTHSIRGERGQGVVEFAVIFPLFILLVAIVFDVGLGFNRQATMQHAVREGARFAALRDNADAGLFVQQRTSGQSHGLVDPSDVAICYDDIDGDGSIGPGDAVDVTATYIYQPIMLRTVAGLFNSSAGDMTIATTGSARLEVALDTAGATC